MFVRLGETLLKDLISIEAEVNHLTALHIIIMYHRIRSSFRRFEAVVVLKDFECLTPSGNSVPSTTYIALMPS